MADLVWVVSQTDVPSVRYAWGKRTKAHTYYRVFDERQEAFDFIRKLRDDEKAYNAAQTAKWRELGFGMWKPSMPQRYAVGQKPRALWPASDGSRNPSPDAWLSMDKVMNRRKREGAKRVAEANARIKARREAEHANNG